MTLRARLLLGLLALATIALAAVGTVTYRELGNSLSRQVDQQLSQAMQIRLDFVYTNNGSPDQGAVVPAGTYYAWVSSDGEPLTRPRIFDYPQYRNEAGPKLPKQLRPGDTFTTSDPHFRGKVLRAFDGSLVVVPLPGHTPGHMALIARGDGTRALLAGDAAHTSHELASLAPEVAAWCASEHVDLLLTHDSSGTAG